MLKKHLLPLTICGLLYLGAGKYDFCVFAFGHDLGIPA